MKIEDEYSLRSYEISSCGQYYKFFHFYKDAKYFYYINDYTKDSVSRIKKYFDFINETSIF